VRLAGRERASPQTRSLPDLLLTIDGSGRWVAHACCAISTSSVPWLELDVWLARSLPATPRGTSPARRRFDESCQGTAPSALIAFLESSDHEDAVSKAVSFGGDAEALACIAGAVAEAYYGGVPLLSQHRPSRPNRGLTPCSRRPPVKS
jgi:hypothetical protein